MGDRLIIQIVSCCAVTLISAVAFAELPQEAIEGMRRGAELYEAGDYEEAEAVFFEAYELSAEAEDGPYALFLFNAARAAQVGGGRARARANYEEALNVDSPQALPPAEQARSKAYIASFDVADGAAKIAAGIDEYIGDTDQNVDLEVAEKELEEPVDDLPPARAVPVKQQGWSPWRWGGIGALVAGAGLVASAGWMGQRADEEIDALWDVEERTSYEEQRAIVEQTQGLGRRFLWAGGAAMVGGLALLVWDLNNADNRTAGALSLRGSSRGILAQWEVRFE